MRESFFMLFVVGALAAGYYYYQNNGGLGPRFESPEQVAASLNKSSGGLHERLNQKHTQQDRARKTRPRIADNASQVERLHTIYPRKNRKVRKRTQKKRPRRYGKRIVKNNNKPKKVMFGVPLKAYVEAQENYIPLSDSRITPTGVRLFVQCMEIKNEGAESLTETQCESLRVATRSHIPSNTGVVAPAEY